jgi:lysophospholipid acyltransferase
MYMGELGGPAIHWTSPQMLLTIKITSFAWSYYDGQKPDEQLLQSQQQRAIKKLPSPLEYYSYIFFFAGFLTGPIAEYKEYSDFTDRSLFIQEKGHIPEGSFFASFKRVLMGLAGIPMHYVHRRFPEFYALTDEFRAHSLLYRLCYLVISCELGFDKYYVAFFLGEGACILSGLGYNGRDEKNRVKWDRVLMLRLLPFKLAQEPSAMAANWNVPSANWLKRYVYIRLLPTPEPAGSSSHKPKSRPLQQLYYQVFPFFATFFVSAIWHGFYAGYYMFFLSLAFFGSLGKLNRIYLRPLVMEADGKTGKVPHKQIYDFICWLAMFLGLNYHILVFRTFTWENGLRGWGSFYFFPHIGGLLWLAGFAVFLLFKRSSRKGRSPEKISQATTVLPTYPPYFLLFANFFCVLGSCVPLLFETNIDLFTQVRVKGYATGFTDRKV